MAVYFRAAVMLIALVGLPAAWVYMGPLPESAQRVVDRLVDVAKEALDWQERFPGDSPEVKSAPRFADRLPEAPRFAQVGFTSEDVLPTADPIPTAVSTETIDEMPSKSPENSGVQDELAKQLQPHFTLLQNLGAAEYALETWGSAGDFYRFRCEIPLGNGANAAMRLFEAVDRDPLATVRQVVGEVTSWQNARETTSLWR